jgi:hypothetical protein
MTYQKGKSKRWERRRNALVDVVSSSKAISFPLGHDDLDRRVLLSGESTVRNEVFESTVVVNTNDRRAGRGGKGVSWNSLLVLCLVLTPSKRKKEGPTFG